MANDFGVAASLAAYGDKKDSVKSFVKSGSADAGSASGVGTGSAAVERIGREQQRRAVAYGRSRGQL